MFRSEERKKEYKKIFDDPRRKREDIQSQIRKQIRDINLQKRRSQGTASNPVEIGNVPQNIDIGNGLRGNNEDSLTSNLNWSPSELEHYANGLRSSDYNKQLACTKQFRKILSLEFDPPIEQVVNSGVVPIFIEFLTRNDAPELQFEAAWAITNIASGTHQQTKITTDHGAVPKLIALLESSQEEVREQAIWALGNIAGDSAECRDLVLGHGALKPLLFLLSNSQRESVIRNATWTISNLCRGKPKPLFEEVRPVIPYISRLIEHPDTEVLTDACWAFSYISDGSEEHIQSVIDSGACPRLIQLMDHVIPAVQTPSLRTVGNIATGNDAQTQVIVDYGCIPILYKLLFSEKKTIKKEACWTLSNIAAGTRDQIEAFLQSDVVEKLLELMDGDDFDIQREASWAICNAASGGDMKQAENLASRGCIKHICKILSTTDTKLIGVALRALDNILTLGQHIMETKELPRNPYATIVREVDAVRMLDVLQDSKVAAIYKKAGNILNRFFPEDRDFDEDFERSDIQFGSYVPEGGFQF
ncbi:importin alpha, putative [Theileria equi strain WA]|uniref:Importin subunit alpha n=1 Tax=Theileria equi strain WA TaxID=1537102 RepID=L0B2M8_THEEQ|nr:importin alpha, putative [Theileria equi strain WA]AFZ81743.1 importin alpha, putative [Theileria equi strain WA]|eukprot:XP_004831409.1 importin alpha, putative [Theileria equi strain WA]